MVRTINLILFGLIALLLTSCSWVVNLVIANNSNRDIFVRYILPGSKENQFFKDPMTYNYDETLLKLYKLDDSKRPESIPTDIRTIPATNELEVRLRPGQAVHVGSYGSFESRQDIVAKHDLTVLINKDSVLTHAMSNAMFRHWKNIRTDLLEIK